MPSPDEIEKVLGGNAEGSADRVDFSQILSEMEEVDDERTPAEIHHDIFYSNDRTEPSEVRRDDYVNRDARFFRI